jgi:hypothetical protein
MKRSPNGWARTETRSVVTSQRSTADAIPYGWRREGSSADSAEVLERMATGLADALRDLCEVIADQVVERVRDLHEPTMNDNATERLLTLPEAARLLRRSDRWVRERVHRYELATVRLDAGALGFKRGDVEAFVDANRVPAMSELRQSPATRRGTNAASPTTKRTITDRAQKGDLK